MLTGSRSSSRLSSFSCAIDQSRCSKNCWSVCFTFSFSVFFLSMIKTRAKTKCYILHLKHRDVLALLNSSHFQSVPLHSKSSVNIIVTHFEAGDLWQFPFFLSLPRFYCESDWNWLEFSKVETSLCFKYSMYHFVLALVFIIKAFKSSFYAPKIFFSFLKMTTLFLASECCWIILLSRRSDACRSSFPVSLLIAVRLWTAVVGWEATRAVRISSRMHIAHFGGHRPSYHMNKVFSAYVSKYAISAPTWHRVTHIFHEKLKMNGGSAVWFIVSDSPR